MCPGVRTWDLFQLLLVNLSKPLFLSGALFVSYRSIGCVGVSGNALGSLLPKDVTF